MGQEINPLETELRKRFTDRDDRYVESTTIIVEVLEPCLLPAMYEVFEVTQKNVTLIELAIVEDMLVIVFALQYDEGVTLPKFVERISPVAEESPKIYRLIRLDIPVNVATTTKEEIIVFLREIASYKDELEEEAPPPVQPKRTFVGFDPSALTDDQLKGLAMSRHTITTTKH